MLKQKVKIYNSYYLNQVEEDIGNSSIIQANKFEINKISEQINKLNMYIEDSNNGMDTTGWKKWKLGADGYPTFE